MNDLYKIRRDNLMSIVLNRFTGNRAALARASSIHPNHINLILSTNETHRRNIGEDLARRMEEALTLPNGWLDNLHGANESEAAFTLASVPIQASLSHILRESPVTGITATGSWIKSLTSETTAVENMFISTVSTAEMSPSLLAGDLVIVDGAVKGFSIEGIYILSVGGDVLLRRIKKSITGGYTVSSATSEETVEQLSSIKILGRVVQKIQMIRV